MTGWALAALSPQAWTPTCRAVDLRVSDRPQHHQIALQLGKVLGAIVGLTRLLVLNDCENQLLVFVKNALHHDG